jgi:GT2 family glycosyltransferase
MPVFVILHYLSAEMTCRCVDTLRKTFAGQNYHIVIVENGSPNQSGAVLQETYGALDTCTVLCSAENLGFARGNNLGYTYAREQLGADYVIVMNNDVLIDDPDFLEKIRKIHHETGYFVLGPDIYACNADHHQNPMRATGYTQAQVEHIISTRKRWLAVYPLHFFYERVLWGAKSVVKKLIGKKSKPLTNPLARLDRLEDPVLHGACYIFSKDFLEVRQEAFHSGTFLYFEEDILHYECLKNGYRMVYDSSLCVTHLEDVSTNTAYRSEYRKRKMKYRNLIRSASVLLRLMEQDQ